MLLDTIIKESNGMTFTAKISKQDSATMTIDYSGPSGYSKIETYPATYTMDRLRTIAESTLSSIGLING
jgi:hypothetical protein